jgi:hypothetical protein
MTFVGSSSRSGSLQAHDVFRTPTPSAIKSELAVSGPCSVAAHAPANDDEQIPVLGPQAPGEEIALSLLATTAPLGDALAHAPAPASTILVFISVSAVSLLATTAPLGDALADPLAHAPASTILVFISVSVVSLLSTTAPLGDALADPLAEAPPHVLPVLNKVDDEIPQILPRPYPVPEEIAQIAVRIAISVAPSLS